MQKYFPAIPDEQLQHFEQLESIYRYWNERINLISRRDIEFLYGHHVLHSLSVFAFLPCEPLLPGTRILDAGTGGGFPGIPMAIYCPKAHFILVDSVAKKIRAVSQIVRQLGLTNVETIHARVETLEVRVDYVVSRAVTNLKELIGWTRHLLAPTSRNVLRNGWWILKGGNVDAEIRRIPFHVIKYPLSSLYPETYYADKYVLYIPEAHGGASETSAHANQKS